MGSLGKEAAGGDAPGIVIMSADEDTGDASERGTVPIGQGIQSLTSTHASFCGMRLRCNDGVVEPVLVATVANVEVSARG